METQHMTVIKHLESQPLTSWQAFELYGITRLAARVNELRGKGWPIKTTLVEQHEKQFARYTLEPGSKTH